MSINIQELVNFKVNGLNEMLTETQKQQLLEYAKQVNILTSELRDVESELLLLRSKAPIKTFTTVNGRTLQRRLLAVDIDYTIGQRAKIFLCGKSNYKLWFINKANKVCLVTNTKIVDNNIYLTCLIDAKGYKNETRMSLDRFLQLIEIGDFKIPNKKFRYYYLKPYHESTKIKGMLEHLENQKDNLTKSIDAILNSTFYKNIENLYKEKESELSRKFYVAAKDLVRDVDADSAKKQKRKKEKCEKSQATIKALWSNVITDAEKAYFVGWLCGHIDNIYIKVVSGGVSDKVISTSYPDAIYGSKYREKANSSGWDASSGKIRFTEIETAPIDTIKALSTHKHITRSASGADVVFKDRTLSNLDLCLFILGNYYEYGFKSGIKNLCDQIEYEALCTDYFPDYRDEFMSGFEA